MVVNQIVNVATWKGEVLEQSFRRPLKFVLLRLPLLIDWCRFASASYFASWFLRRLARAKVEILRGLPVVVLA